TLLACDSSLCALLSRRDTVLSSSACVHPNPHSFPTRRSSDLNFWSSKLAGPGAQRVTATLDRVQHRPGEAAVDPGAQPRHMHLRSEEHTSELQSRENLVCRLLLEKKKQVV